jgi:hypothetical protein
LPIAGSRFSIEKVLLQLPPPSISPRRVNRKSAIPATLSLAMMTEVLRKHKTNFSEVGFS